MGADSNAGLFKLTRGRRLVLGFVTAWPLAITVAVAAHPAARVFLGAQGWRTQGQAISGAQAAALAIYSVTFVLTAALVLFYFAHLTQTRRLNDGQRIPWALLLVFGSVLVMPFYWFFYVWRPPPPADDAAQQDGGD